MTEGMEAITSASLSLALDAASLRQQAIATNIANAGSAGYLRQGVTFEGSLQQLRDSLRDGAGPGSAALALAGLAPRLTPALAADGSPQTVQLDVEMADLAHNTVHYQALLKALSRHYAVLSSAISDGKK